MTKLDRQTISDLTAFDAADTFDSAEQVRAYFVLDMLQGNEADLTQDDLDLMAEAVIENRWHFTLAAMFGGKQESS